MKRFVTLFLTLFLLAPGLVLAEQSSKKTKKNDPLSLAALMIKDQHYERAQSILEKIDIEVELEKDKDFDLARYHTLNGVTYLNMQAYQDAIPHFQKVLELDPNKTIFHVYLAQAYYKNGDYQLAIEQIDAAPDQKAENPNLILMKFDAYKKVDNLYAGWDALKEGQGLYPYEDSFPKQMIFTLIELGFYHQAAEIGLKYTEDFQPEPIDYIAIGSALSRAGNYELAGQFLEGGKLFFPNEIDANKALANYYTQQGKYFVAARIMEPVATVDNDLMTEAAELNKKSKQYVRALFLNTRATEQNDKLKQRLALYLESEDFERAAAMEQELKLAKVLEDDNVKYALAYAMFKVGDFEATERVLSQIRDGRVFQKANLIRSAMADCQDNKWRCM